MGDTGKPIIWIIVPCYDEEAVLPVTAPLFREKIVQLASLGIISTESSILFVDDGSSDDTWKIIQALSNNDSCYRGVKLSRNRGHQNALMCGLMESLGKCDASISIDCDGQDDINAIDEMVGRFLDGDDIVLGVRSDRTSDTAFKRYSAQAFYRLMGDMGAETVYNHADYRLLSDRALASLAEYGEINLFLRGLVTQLGYPSSIVTYERNERMAGESHYPLKKMIALAINGITSMSTRPIRIVASLGLLFSSVGFIGVLWAAVSFVSGQAVSGWASTIVIMSLIGGMQLLSLGVIGEYIGKIYLETKARPRYFVESRTWNTMPRRYRG